MRKEDVKKGSIYELDGVVPLKEALPLGIQHVFNVIKLRQFLNL